MGSQDRWAEAEAFEAAGNAQAALDIYGKLGNAELAAGRFDSALAAYRRALPLAPGNPHLLNNIGVTLRRLDRLDVAEEWFCRAIDADPRMASAYSNRGNVRSTMGNGEAALADHRAALKLDPDSPVAHINLGYALRELGRNEEALAAYDRALELKPDHAHALHDRGQLLLLMGRMKEGFAGVEARWNRDYNYKEKRRDYNRPVWRGEPPEALGGRLLVLPEQGFGDAIHFSRYLPLLAERGYNVIFQSPAPLYRLLATGMIHPRLTIVPAESGAKRLPWFARPFAPSPRLPGFAAFVGIMSLPDRFGTTLETIPAATPYIKVAPHLSALWKRRLETEVKAAPSTLKVGFVWQGDPKHQRDRQRSIPVKTLMPVLAKPGVQFYSLQKGPGAAYPFPHANVISLGNRLGDFADTAAVMDQLDLIIAVDTAVAHLAGALNRPVWVMLTEAPEWRWLLNTDRSPWYPSGRLFRQPRPGDWTSVVEQIGAALDKMMHARQS